MESIKRSFLFLLCFLFPLCAVAAAEATDEWWREDQVIGKTLPEAVIKFLGTVNLGSCEVPKVWPKDYQLKMPKDQQSRSQTARARSLHTKCKDGYTQVTFTFQDARSTSYFSGLILKVSSNEPFDLEVSKSVRNQLSTLIQKEMGLICKPSQDTPAKYKIEWEPFDCESRISPTTRLLFGLRKIDKPEQARYIEVSIGLRH